MLSTSSYLSDQIMDHLPMTKNYSSPWYLAPQSTNPPASFAREERVKLVTAQATRNDEWSI
jgi:hypothetical protein